jgi:predicted glutamine amidotransferase
MKLFACMCNQPQRLAAALAPVRATLVAPATAAAPITRWGLGYIQGGDVLLVRTPKASPQPVDLAGPLAEIATDCAIAQAVTSSAFSGTDNTPPFRYRRWLYAQTGLDALAKPGLEELSPRLLEHIPEYLRRNIRGRTPAELVFHVFLSMLHDEGNIDDPNLPTAATRRALAATLKVVTTEIEKLGANAVALGNVALTNGRSMVVARGSDTEPLRLRRLTVHNERGEIERGADSFRGVLLVSGDEGDPREGFEEVPARHSVLISRDLQVTFADLAP